MNASIVRGITRPPGCGSIPATRVYWEPGPDRERGISMTAELQQFASDNYAGICPEAWTAMEKANRGHVPAYGEDQWTQAAADGFRELFEKGDAEVFFAFNGTAANSLALASLCQSYHSVICAASAHVETDECGAPEFFSNGSKLLVASSADGKLTPELVRALASSRSDIHFPKPRVVTITQATETGLVYSRGRNPATFGDLPRTGLAAAHGRRALCQCLRQPWLLAGRHHLEGRRRPALFRRHQERHGGRRSRHLLRSASWRQISTIAASRPASSPRKCASSPRPGSACSKAARG